MSDPLIQARGVTKILEGIVPVTLVRDIDLSIGSGEFVAITGPSGSGKSSLLYLLGLLDLPSSGEVLIDGHSTIGMSDDERARVRLARLGFVFQFHFLLPEFTLTENVAMPMRALGVLRNRLSSLGRMNYLLHSALATIVTRRPINCRAGSASVWPSRAPWRMIHQSFLPTSRREVSNSISTGQVFGILQDLVAIHGKTVVAVTHDLTLASRMHRRIHIVDGCIDATGGKSDSREMVRHPDVV